MSDTAGELTHLQRKALSAFQGHERGWGLPFKAISETGNVPLHLTRRVVRAVARKGYLEYLGPLWNEYDGKLCGSGYGLTRKGEEWLCAHHNDVP